MGIPGWECPYLFGKKNCSLQHWRGSALAFPRGEGGFSIAQTWAIEKTDEEWQQNQSYTQKQQNRTMIKAGISLYIA